MRHSLGRPSRSDFVQLEFAGEYGVVLKAKDNSVWSVDDNGETKLATLKATDVDYEPQFVEYYVDNSDYKPNNIEYEVPDLVKEVNLFVLDGSGNLVKRNTSGEEIVETGVKSFTMNKTTSAEDEEQGYLYSNASGEIYQGVQGIRKKDTRDGLVSELSFYDRWSPINWYLTDSGLCADEVYGTKDWNSNVTQVISPQGAAFNFYVRKDGRTKGSLTIYEGRLLDYRLTSNRNDLGYLVTTTYVQEEELGWCVYNTNAKTFTQVDAQHMQGRWIVRKNGDLYLNDTFVMDHVEDYIVYRPEVLEYDMLYILRKDGTLWRLVVQGGTIMPELVSNLENVLSLYAGDMEEVEGSNEETPEPSTSPEPTSSPSAAPTVSTTPTSNPSAAPTASTTPTSSPSAAPTASTTPTSSPSAAPTASAAVTSSPSAAPTASAATTSSPSASTAATSSPSASTAATKSPSTSTTPTSSASAGTTPTKGPSTSTTPTSSASTTPTSSPSTAPTASATVTSNPSITPTASASTTVTTSPSTVAPSTKPSVSPSEQITTSPSADTTNPSSKPTDDLDMTPSVTSSVVPTDHPNTNQPGTSETVGSVIGDTDGDGSVTLKDAQLVLKAALKIIPLSDINAAVDVDGKAGIALGDAQMILKAALKIINLEPAKEISCVDGIKVLALWIRKCSDKIVEIMYN